MLATLFYAPNPFWSPLLWAISLHTLFCARPLLGLAMRCATLGILLRGSGDLAVLVLLRKSHLYNSEMSTCAVKDLKTTRVVFVVVACAVSEHRSRGPVESCGVVCCTSQALSLFPESCGSCVTLHKLCHCFLSHGTLCCVSHCVCVLSSLSIVLLCIYTAVDWELSPQSHSLHCRLVASLFCP